MMIIMFKVYNVDGDASDLHIKSVGGGRRG